MEELGLRWAEEQANTMDRLEWRRLIEGLCPSRDKEVERVSG